MCVGAVGAYFGSAPNGFHDLLSHLALLEADSGMPGCNWRIAYMCDRSGDQLLSREWLLR
jgi:hypothetical protein